MATPRERALSLLHQQLEWGVMFHDEERGEPRPERDGRVAGTLGALRAVGLLSVEEAGAWRTRLSAPRQDRPTPTTEAREAAEGLLEEMLDALPADQQGVREEVTRFHGALQALAAIGAAGAEWEERLRLRMGWPSAAEQHALDRELGGTQEELVAVLPGPVEAAEGVRVIYALRFSDVISFLIRHEGGDDWWEADRWSNLELLDDVGTTYSPAGGGGGDREEDLSFCPAPPPEATWVELRGVASQPLRVPL